MDNSSLFPIKFCQPLSDIQNFPSYFFVTIPFALHNEFYTITQEDCKHFTSMRIYTINKVLLGVQTSCLVGPLNCGAINFKELKEVINFMMNAADVELQKRNVTLGCQQVVYPMYSTEPICWNKSMLMPTIFTHHVNLNVFHYDRSTSTSELLANCHQQMKNVNFGDSKAGNSTSTQATRITSNEKATQCVIDELIQKATTIQASQETARGVNVNQFDPDELIQTTQPSFSCQVVQPTQSIRSSSVHPTVQPNPRVILTVPHRSNLNYHR